MAAIERTAPDDADDLARMWPLKQQAYSWGERLLLDRPMSSPLAQHRRAESGRWRDAFRHAPTKMVKAGECIMVSAVAPVT